MITGVLTHSDGTISMIIMLMVPFLCSLSKNSFERASLYGCDQHLAVIDSVLRGVKISVMTKS